MDGDIAAAATVGISGIEAVAGYMRKTLSVLECLGRARLLFLVDFLDTFNETGAAK